MSQQDDNNTMQESLECPICKDLFAEPKQLDCGHTYCLECVEHLEKVPFVAHQIVREEFFEILGVGPVNTLAQRVQNNVQCPQCRKLCLIPEGGINTNYALKGMVNKFRDTSITEGGSCSSNKLADADGAEDRQKANNGGEAAELFPCQSCEKRAPECEMFVCKQCKSTRKPIKRQFICALCVISWHRQHNIVRCSELASTRDREQAAQRIEQIGSEAHEFIDGVQNIPASLSKGFEALRKKLLLKFNHIQLLQIECFNTDANPLKEDVEVKVQLAHRYWAQLNLIFTKMHELKSEFDAQLKGLEQRIDTVFVPPPLPIGSWDQQPSSSAATDGQSPFDWNHTPPQNQFVYCGKEHSSKKQRRPLRMRPRRINNNNGTGADTDNNAAVYMPAGDE